MRPACRQRGIAVMTALVLIGMVGVSVAALGTLLNVRMHQANRAAAQAQLRQLLNAGAMLALTQAERWTGQTGEMVVNVPLPASLKSDRAGLELRVLAHEDTALKVNIAARVDDHEASEDIILGRRNDAWRVEKVVSLQSPVMVNTHH